MSGFPTPKITWFLNNDIINGNDDFEHIDVKDGGIEIMDALESDSGIYQCVAKNDGGEIKAFAQFNVKRKFCKKCISFVLSICYVVL